jgi:hypothetical protein
MSNDYSRGYDSGLAAGEAHRHALEETNIKLCAEVERLKALLQSRGQPNDPGYMLPPNISYGA